MYIAFFFHQDAFVSSLKEMTPPAMGRIALLGVDTIELAHAFGEITFDGFYHQVIVVVHLAVGVTHPVEPSAHLAE